MEAARLTTELVDSITDDAVVRRVLSGETSLFEILLRRHNQKLYRVIRSYIPKDEDIDDVMQETYLKAYLKLYQFGNKAMFSTWLIRIGINEALQKMRKSPKVKFVNLYDEENALQIADAAIPTDLISAQPDAAELIQKAFESLPKKYKVVFMLKEYEGMEIAEIARCLDLSISNVKIRLFRARAIMKETVMADVKDTGAFSFGNMRCDRIVHSVMSRVEPASLN